MKEETFRTRYPNYNVLDKWSSLDWDDQTREVVRKRLEDVPPIRFFTDEEAYTLTAVAERIVPQPDRLPAERVSIVPWIDEKLHEDKRDGYRYEEMPAQREAWRLGVKGINETAQALFDDREFVALDASPQDVVLTHIKVLVRGCTKLGIPVAPAPIATLSAPYKDRPPCVYRGFCNYGCTTNAKSSILVTYIPRAIRAGAEVRANSIVAQVEHDKRGLVTGVLYFRKGSDELHRQRAQNVVVAGYAVETPRLLLNSASSLFPDGLANSSGLVGKCFMVHTGEQVFARFPQRINQYKAPPPGGAITEHFNRTMPDTDFVCGYSIEVVGPHPADFAARLTTARKLWGAELRRTMLDYNYFAGLGIVGEVLPQMSNVVKLHNTERDQYGLPVAHVIFSHHENDKRMVAHAKLKMKEILDAAGGEDIWTADRTAHLLGTCRMGNDPKNSVVNANCLSHDVPNLYICDGSVFTTSTGVNPSLTIEAIAARTADRICERN